MRQGAGIGRARATAMSRRTALRSVGLGALGVLALGSAPLHGQNPFRISGADAKPASAQGDEQPNIILILTDDMRADDLHYLPAVQKLLVAQGAAFTSFSCSSPGCAPARATILRGQYPQNHGLLRGSGNAEGAEDFRRNLVGERGRGDPAGADVFQKNGDEASTVATWLQDAGYRTALIGKYLNGYGAAMAPTSIPPGWDEWHGLTNEGYSRFEINENGTLVRYKSNRVQVYSTDILARQAMDFIARTIPTRQPFFLFLAPRAPHGPTEPATRHLMAFADLTPPYEANFNEADVSDKPAWVQALPELDEAQIMEMQAFFCARLETLLAVDEMVTSIVNELAAAGALDNTYIVFSSDNGFHRGEHRIARDKGSPYEEAILVPLVMRGPGIPAGMTIDALTSQVDLAPTFAAWAGATIPEFVDGRSLVALFAGAPPSWRYTMLVQQYADHPEQSIKQPGFHALRGDDFIYVEYSSGERELYDLAWDPDELDNVVTKVDNIRVAELSKRLAAMTRCTGASCRAIEEAPLLSVTPFR